MTANLKRISDSDQISIQEHGKKLLNNLESL
jgi:hypothetical protein